MQRAFTLVELLVVLAVIALLAAILFPVFAQSRQKARQTVCASNQRQLGLAILQYVQDYDEAFPNGINIIQQQRVWPGEGWAGQCLPYCKHADLFRCPADITSAPTDAVPRRDFVVSFGYNINYIGYFEDQEDAPPSGLSLADLTSAGQSVLLFEVSGVHANVFAPQEGAGTSQAGAHFSASSNGLDNRLYAQKNWSTSTANQYATGYLGGRKPLPPAKRNLRIPLDVTHRGATYLLGDGHAKWLRGDSVSSGLNALAPQCNQDNQPFLSGCGGSFYAAGVESASSLRATFSTR